MSIETDNNDNTSSKIISNLEQATQYFVDKILKGKGMVDKQHDELRGAICYVVTGEIETPLHITVMGRYYLFFKRQPFFTYSKQVNDYTNGEQAGLAINANILRFAYLENAEIVVVMKDGTIYSVNSMEFMRYSIKNNTLLRSFEQEEVRGMPLSKFKKC